ncbi:MULTISPECIES: amino acid ABC transporter ATP-binding protein [Pseudobutyrivibrio]|jgi:polar amino acid transport system ATP-binding protein|uniref:Amino acid ABC transporter ATP-binding protein n=2 Tax=Pseudobutyrivibrio TaxID=46205 RepID=A0A2G3DSL5_9FIRM|nr:MULTISPECIES: amino acid ABC transporter ATP-binding protein [Pseudobutyrivibrio]MBE5904853.1 amino acid ABC transporter ATP-binding protein [Pseudobutyrivibrio sp.]NEX01450.1 amino acid ABC transporter ATP-binding protein [Pseudobutyrivibrio xylanivorans]PHU34027.1 amino acid ABC transporter ATP-binding protein [Pseudobutyrivibrio ruminis]PHU40695.1 amino acid ABC transporter ATP-binding protein [Pseudobutyrivibrio ruminis]SCY39691.1 polar amino acid transport system ATP-binding protein [P
MELLKVTHLHKEFGQNTVLNDINLSVEKGEVVVIIGPSGCGKSTFLRCLNGLEEIQGGVITISGLPVEAGKRDITKLRQKIGMVFQSYELFPHKTVLENIILAPTKVQKRDKEEATKEAIELLDKVGLVDKKDYYPRQLSGGQKQRVAIVRALLMHPEVILFDEVTAALDPEMVHEVLETMIALAKAGSTMLIVTHEMAFAKAIADRIIFIDKGDIVEETRDVKEFFIEPKTERAKKFLKTFAYE